MGDAMILVFWMLSFKPTFPLSSFTFIKRLFSFSLLYVVREVSFAYLRLLIFLPAILIPPCVHPARHFPWCTLITQLVKNLPAMKETPVLFPRLGRSTGEGIGYSLQYSWASLVAQLVKNPPAMWETWVPSLGWEDPLEKEKATHSSILSWRIQSRIQSMGLQRVRHDWVTFTFAFTLHIS